MKKTGGLFCLMFILVNASFAQHYTHADTLRGSNGPGRDWWNATKYDLNIKFNLQDSTISGYNIISFKVLKKANEMQIDLQQPMVIDSVLLLKADVARNAERNEVIVLNNNDGIYRDGNAFFLN